MEQQTFNPVDFTWTWTATWYNWNRAQAHKQALAARNAEAKKQREQGKRVRCQTLKGQRITRGGIGSGHPHIEQVVNVYMLTAT